MVKGERITQASWIDCTVFCFTCTRGLKMPLYPTGVRDIIFEGPHPFTYLCEGCHEDNNGN